MVYLFSVVALFVCIASVRSRREGRSPLGLGLSVWLGSMVLGPLVFRFTVPYVVIPDVFVTACLGATTAAYLLVRKPRQVAPTEYAEKTLEIRLAQLLGAIGIVGCLLLLADAHANGTPLSFSYLLNNLGSVRAKQFDALASSAPQSPLRVIGTYMASCSFLVVLAASRLGRVGGLRLLAVVNLALMAAVSLLVYAGRATLFDLVLLLLVSAYLLRRPLLPRNPRAIALGAIVVAGVWYFSVPYLSTREGYTDPIEVLAATQRAHLRYGLEPVAQKDQAFGLAMVSLGYFTSPLATLSYYIQQGPPPGPLWGGYSFPLLARTVAKLKGTNSPDLWLKNREQVFLPLQRAGYFPNVWATWLRDLLVDFGYVGAVLFSGTFGVFLAWARNAFERTGLLYYHYFEAIACLVFAFGAFTSLLWNAFLSDAFFIALALALLIRVRAFSPFEPQ